MSAQTEFARNVQAYLATGMIPVWMAEALMKDARAWVEEERYQDRRKGEDPSYAGEKRRWTDEERKDNLLGVGAIYRTAMRVTEKALGVQA